MTQIGQNMPILNMFHILYCSCGPSSSGEMVSRRKILSRSRDDLNLEAPAQAEDEEDVWYQKEKLYKVSFLKPNS